MGDERRVSSTRTLNPDPPEGHRPDGTPIKRAPAPSSVTVRNQEFTTRLLRDLAARIAEREKAGVFGELNLKISFQRGEMTTAKFVAEDIQKPGD